MTVAQSFDRSDTVQTDHVGYVLVLGTQPSSCMWYATGSNEGMSLAGSIGRKLLDDWQQCVGIVSFEWLDVANLVHRVVDVKHPSLFLCELVTAVVFCLHGDGLINLYATTSASQNQQWAAQFPWAYVTDVLVPLNHEVEETLMWFLQSRNT